MIKRTKETIRSLIGLTSANRNVTVYSDDVFLVSYPRSGNTWTRFLIGNLVNIDEPIDFGKIELRIPDIHQNSDRKLRQLNRPRILKSHESFDPRYKKIIYLVRDPRKVVVSYYYYHLKVRKIEESYSLDSYVDRFIEGKLPSDKLNPFGSWADNVSSWLGATQNNSSHFLLIRYEDMIKDTMTELKKIAFFLDIDTNDKQLTKVINLSSVENMCKLEKSNIHLWKPMKGSRNDIPFIRSSNSNTWKANLSSNSIKKIEFNWEWLMAELGYF